MGFDIGSIFAGGAEGLFKGIRDIIGAFKADPTVVAQNAQKLAELEVAVRTAELQAEVQLTTAQTKINEIEAASTDKFAARWRPAVGWICAIGLFYATLGAPLVGWISINVGWKPPGELNLEILTTTLFALLGIGGMRSFEKYKGVTK